MQKITLGILVTMLILVSSQIVLADFCGPWELTGPASERCGSYVLCPGGYWDYSYQVQYIYERECEDAYNNTYYEYKTEWTTVGCC